MWNYIFYLPHPTSISQGLRSRKPEFNTILTVSERDPLSLQAAQYSLCFQSCPPFSEKNGQSTPKYCTPKYSWKIVWTWSLFTAAMQAILAPEPLRDISNYHIHVFTLVAVLAVWNLSPVPFYTSKTKISSPANAQMWQCYETSHCCKAVCFLLPGRLHCKDVSLSPSPTPNPRVLPRPFPLPGRRLVDSSWGFWRNSFSRHMTVLPLELLGSAASRCWGNGRQRWMDHTQSEAAGGLRWCSAGEHKEWWSQYSHTLQAVSFLPQTLSHSLSGTITPPCMSGHTCTCSKEHQPRLVSLLLLLLCRACHPSQDWSLWNLNHQDSSCL